MSEFERILRLDTLGSAEREMTLEANADERTALARRFGLAAIDQLVAKVAFHRTGETVELRGELEAQVIQHCVASGAPVPARISEPFRLRFVPEAMLESDAEEIELSADDCDVIGYAGGQIDLGEAVAETLALALDPFPRSPDADAALREAGVMSEEDAGPFSALKGLRDRLSGKS